MEKKGYITDQSKRLDSIFAALSDATRRAILARLAEGQATVSELALPFATTQPAISKHLKVLESAGLVTQIKDAQRRPRKLDARPLASASLWLADYRELWSASSKKVVESLDELKSEKKKGKKHKRKKH
jgi:DNA-binding transcriptional ArsR family regulator